MMKTKIFLSLFIFIAGSLLPLLALSQGVDPGCNPDLPCPIDGGLSLLIAAGIGIGAKKAYDKKRTKTSV